MRRFQRLVILILLASGLYLQGTNSSRAEALEIVFKDSIWGAAIGAVSGLATWALQDADGDDKLFSDYVVKNSAIGIFVGMAFGIYDASQGGVFMSNKPVKGLLDYKYREKLFTMRPAQLIPKINFSQDQMKMQLKIFSSSF